MSRALAASAVALAVIAVNLMQACVYRPPASLDSPENVYAIIDSAPYVEATVREREVVVDDPGKLHVEHGRSCAEAREAASEDYIGMRITESIELPAGYTGTVYQNGYDLEYLSKDHHVVGLGSAIYNIHTLNNILFWDAGGVISDRNGDDSYRWCYAYTVVAWPEVTRAPGGAVRFFDRLDIAVTHADQHASLIYTDLGSGGVHRIKGVYQSPDVKPKAVLLAGFATSFTDDDHHVLQFGFDLGTPKIRNRKVKWRSDVAFKDNDTREFRSAEIVSVLGGQSVYLFQPQTVTRLPGTEGAGAVNNHLRLQARSPRSCGAALGTPALKREEFVVQTPPYTWAMPMLTGWDLAETCGDEHKRRIGAWIEDFSYQRLPGDSFGTLRYTVRSAFGDKDPFGFGDRLQVDVLGIKPVLQLIDGIIDQIGGDLVSTPPTNPLPPSRGGTGTGPLQF